MGFVLELTSVVSGEPRFAGWAASLEDHRRTAARAFFHSAGRSAPERELAGRRTPDVARRSGFLMNMSLETFASTFRKHVEG